MPSSGGAKLFEDLQKPPQLSPRQIKGTVDLVRGVITPAGGVEPNDHVVLGDNVRIKLGDDAELNIYFDGTDAIIANGSGKFYIRGTLVIDTPAAIKLDGADGSVAAGDVGLAEAGGTLSLSSRDSVLVAIDNDNDSTTASFTIQRKDMGNISLFQITEAASSGETLMLVYDVDNASLERVSVGAADSGGSGYKVLRIPN